MTSPFASSPTAPGGVTLQILSIVFYTFIAFFCIGLPIAVIPGYVHDVLGFNAVLAGVVIAAQYVATLLIRPLAGRLADSWGAKRTITYGLYAVAASGLLTLIATLSHGWPSLSLGVLLVARLLLGVGQGMIGVGTSSWGIGQVGPEHTAKVISWNGIASYGAIAVGAPLGVVMTEDLGFHSLGGALLVLALFALWRLRKRESVPVVRGERLPFWSAFGRVAPYGLGLCLASIGYGALTTFITLYYLEQGWAGAAFCLTAFGACFILSRLLFINAINHYGGYSVAFACLSVETLGFLFLWLAPSPVFALIGAALAGFGLSLVYPALGVLAIAQVPTTSRGAGLGAFAVFFDIALAIAGPLMGALAANAGYAAIFLCAAGLSVVGLGLIGWLSRDAKRPL
ncbi:MFS transporter [Pseudomonas sp. DC3200b2]|uniref:MFS transporter n=1 Tax=Pseudomonas sp. DC3200b2 TaxID=2804669 RepID=UPI003CF28564